MSGKFKRDRFDWGSIVFTGLCGLAVGIILLMLFLIIGNIVINGWSRFSWKFITHGTEAGMFNIEEAGVWPEIFPKQVAFAKRKKPVRPSPLE